MNKDQIADSFASNLDAKVELFNKLVCGAHENSFLETLKKAIQWESHKSKHGVSITIDDSKGVVEKIIFGYKNSLIDRQVVLYPDCINGTFGFVCLDGEYIQYFRKKISPSTAYDELKKIPEYLGLL